MVKKLSYPYRRLFRLLYLDSLYWLFVVLAIMPISSAFAEEAIDLHMENCVACHSAMTGGKGTLLYTREDHTVKNFEALGKQVNRCQSSLGLNWSNKQIEIVQRYLNTEFYKY